MARILCSPYYLPYLPYLLSHCLSSNVKRFRKPQSHVPFSPELRSKTSPHKWLTAIYEPFLCCLLPPKRLGLGRLEHIATSAICFALLRCLQCKPIAIELAEEFKPTMKDTQYHKTHLIGIMMGHISAE